MRRNTGTRNPLRFLIYYLGGLLKHEEISSSFCGTSDFRYLFGGEDGDGGQLPLRKAVLRVLLLCESFHCDRNSYLEVRVKVTLLCKWRVWGTMVK